MSINRTMQRNYEECKFSGVALAPVYVATPKTILVPKARFLSISIGVQEEWTRIGC